MANVKKYKIASKFNSSHLQSDLMFDRISK